MTREEFVLNFIIAFNKGDKDKASSSKEHWKNKGFTGEFLYYLRNILIHETIDYSTLDSVKNIIGYQEVLAMFEDIDRNISDAEKLVYIKYISDNYEAYFESRGYKRIDTDRYHYYQKGTSITGLNKNIFIYENSDTKAGFMTISVHSFNHENGEKNQIISDDIPLSIYVRSEVGGYMLINYYELDNDIPIKLEFNVNENWFNLVIPKLELYDDIRVKLNLDESIDVKLTKEEFQQKLNGIYLKNSTEIRKIIREIESGFRDMKSDLSDINIV